MTTGWLTGLVAAIPPLAGVIAKIWLGSSDSRLVRKIEKDIALYELAPERAKGVLKQLIYAETLAHAQRRLNAANRKIKWPIAFWIVVGATMTGFGCWALGNVAVTRG